MLGALIGHVDQRVESLEKSLPGRISDAITDALDGRMLSDDERRWVRLAIQAEGQRMAFRRAVIEKTFTGLVWVVLAGTASIIWRLASEWVVSHFGFKP